MVGGPLATTPTEASPAHILKFLLIGNERFFDTCRLPKLDIDRILQVEQYRNKVLEAYKI